MLLLIPGVSGCGADSDAQTAAREMLQASEDGDCEKAAGYIDLEETMRELGVEISMDDLVEACEAEKEESPLVDFEITGETEVEDGVEVSVELVNEVNGEEVTSEDTIMMKEIGGEWKIIP
jgi:hypothetical protein